MHWSPDSDYLLVSGHVDLCEGYCLQETNWLIDGQSGEILAWLIVRSDGSAYRELTMCGFSPACVGWLAN